MKENTGKSGSAFWILLIVGAKSLFMSLSTLSDVSSDAEVLLRGLAFIAAASAFTSAHLLKREKMIVRHIAIIPFAALVTLLASLSFVGYGDVGAGGSIIGCSFVLFLGSVTVYKIHMHFREKIDASMQETT